MNNQIYKLTDIMTIIKSDGAILISGKSTKTPLQTKQRITNLTDHIKDDNIERDFLDDFSIFLENTTKEKRIEYIKRYQRIIKEIKARRGRKCQICGESFKKDDGEYYCEAHHINPLSLDGSQHPQNVLILCAHHHRMFHYAKNKIEIKILTVSKMEITIEGRLYTVVCD